MRGHCGTCLVDVVVDGRPGDEHETTWSHMREETVPVTVAGHADGCFGDCDRHGCPVPVQDYERGLVECGPVTVDPNSLTDIEAWEAHERMLQRLQPDIFKEMAARAAASAPGFDVTLEGLWCRRCSCHVQDRGQHVEYHRRLSLEMNFLGAAFGFILRRLTELVEGDDD